MWTQICYCAKTIEFEFELYNTCMRDGFTYTKRKMRLWGKATNLVKIGIKGG